MNEELRRVFTSNGIIFLYIIKDGSKYRIMDYINSKIYDELFDSIEDADRYINSNLKDGEYILN